MWSIWVDLRLEDEELLGQFSECDLYVRWCSRWLLEITCHWEWQLHHHVNLFLRWEFYTFSVRVLLRSFSLFGRCAFPFFNRFAMHSCALWILLGGEFSLEWPRHWTGPFLKLIVPKLMNVFEFVRICPNVFELVQIGPNLSKVSQICPNWIEFVQMCPNLHEFARMCPNLSETSRIGVPQNRPYEKLSTK